MELPGGPVTTEAVAMLLDAVDRGVVRILDLEFVAKDSDAALSKAAVADPAGLDVGVWDGSSSGLLDRSDLDEVGSSIEPGSVTAVLIHEDPWAVRLDRTLRHHGARLIADGRIAAEEIVTALVATEPR